MFADKGKTNDNLIKNWDYVRLPVNFKVVAGHPCERNYYNNSLFLFFTCILMTFAHLMVSFCVYVLCIKFLLVSSYVASIEILSIEIP